MKMDRFDVACCAIFVLGCGLMAWSLASFHFDEKQCEKAGGVLVSGKCLDPKAIIKIKENKDAD